VLISDGGPAVESMANAGAVDRMRAKSDMVRHTANPTTRGRMGHAYWHT